MNVAAPSATGTVRRAHLWRPLLEALRGLGPRHLVAALVVALLIFLLRGFYVVVLHARGDALGPHLPPMLFRGIALVLGIVVADAYVRDGVRPRVAYPVAVVAAAVVTSLLGYHLNRALGSPGWHGGQVPREVHRLEIRFNVIQLTLMYGFLTAAWLQWRDRDSALRRLQASELRRADAERHMKQTQLRALQARVEPELLFAALERVGELAGTAANERADRLLDDLIALLRLLMPGGSNPDERAATTVERELATAVAYLRVHDACAGASRDLTAAVAADAAEQPLPPMLVLPVARAIARHEAAERAALRIRAARSGGRLAIVFARDAGSVQPLLDAGDVAELGRSLEQHFGKGVASVVATDVPATLALSLPLAHESPTTDGADR
jgi:hypothetical protein